VDHVDFDVDGGEFFDFSVPTGRENDPYPDAHNAARPTSGKAIVAGWDVTEEPPR